jgi:hypothetical protein
LGPDEACEEGAGVDEHPQYRMWKDRLDGERQADAVRRARSSARELSLAEWRAAWASYKGRAAAAAVARPVPRWWNLFGWMRWLLHLHTPGRPG